jgi:hypothetical protein
VCIARCLRQSLSQVVPLDLNTARLRKIVGWVEALRNPTEPTKCWVRSSTQRTRVKVFGLNLRSIALAFARTEVQAKANA